MGMDVLRAIEGIEIFPIVSLLLFLVVFTLMLVRAARLDRAHLARCARLPLEDGPDAAAPAAGDHIHG